MKPVIAYRDSFSPLHALRCDPAQCTTRRAASDGMDDLAAWKLGYCMRDGCYLGGSLTVAGRDLIAERWGYRITEPGEVAR